MRIMMPTMDNFNKEIKDKEVVVFGAGEYCMRFLNRINEEAFERISFIVDNSIEKQGTSLYGITIKSPDEINKLEPMNTVVVIAVSNGIPEVYEQICEKGHYNIMSACILMNEIFSQVAKALIENQDEINKVAEILYDEKSKWIYNEVIKRRMLYGECVFSDLLVRGDAEYRMPIMYRKDRPKDEVIIDCGAYNGDTLKKFIETYGAKLKKIYAFECEEESREELALAMMHIKNKKIHPEMILMPYALSDYEGKMKFAKLNKKGASFLVDNRGFAEKVFYERDYVEVDVTTLDKVIPENEKVTFIKMDIEGSEYAALQGAERLIKNCKPKLAISLYHCGEDYYRIPLYLKSIVPEYKFAVRHHKKNHVDTDLYCWIEE